MGFFSFLFLILMTLKLLDIIEISWTFLCVILCGDVIIFLMGALIVLLTRFFKTKDK